MLHTDLTTALSTGRPAADGPRLLVLCDQASWTQSLESILDPSGYQVFRAATPGEALDLLRGTEVDALIVHERAVTRSGEGLSQLLGRILDRAGHLPVLLLAESAGGRKERLRALRAGAWEYFSAPPHAEELLLKLRAYTAAKREADRARDQGLVDAATGLYNAQGILRSAREAGQMAHRYGRPIACAAFSAGSAGADGETVPADSDIAPVVRLLTQHARGSDIVGRLNRSELIVLAPETDAAGVLTFADRLLRLAQAEEPSGSRPAGETAALRVGCCAVDSVRDARIDALDLVVKATLALRRAQTVGSERPVFFSD